MTSHQLALPTVFPSDWQHPDWTTDFYGKPLSDAARIEFLAHYFDCAELRHTQWEFPRPETMAVWAHRVAHNPRFRFHPLLHRVFTHERSLDPALVEQFCIGLRPLRAAGRMGCLVMQFPWVFKFTEENKQSFLALRRAFAEFPLVAEFRHASWQFPEALGVLIDYKVGYVNVDLPHHIRATGPSAELTSPIAYFRLHGHRRELWHREWEHQETRFVREPYEYSTLQLTEWQRRIERIAPYADSCFVAFANDAEAWSPQNALSMRALLGDARADAPEALLTTHGYALEGFTARRPIQGSLIPRTALRRFAASA